MKELTLEMLKEQISTSRDPLSKMSVELAAIGLYLESEGVDLTQFREQAIENLFVSLTDEDKASIVASMPGSMDITSAEL